MGGDVIGQAHRITPKAHPIRLNAGESLPFDAVALPNLHSPPGGAPIPGPSRTAGRRELASPRPRAGEGTGVRAFPSPACADLDSHSRRKLGHETVAQAGSRRGDRPGRPYPLFGILPPIPSPSSPTARGRELASPRPPRRLAPFCAYPAALHSRGSLRPVPRTA